MPNDDPPDYCHPTLAAVEQAEWAEQRDLLERAAVEFCEQTRTTGEQAIGRAIFAALARIPSYPTRADGSVAAGSLRDFIARTAPGHVVTCVTNLDGTITTDRGEKFANFAAFKAAYR